MTTATRLKALKEEFQKDGANILDVTAPVALILSDVCNVLNLSQAECNEVLGAEAAGAIEEWETARIWQPAEKETAAYPVTELAAVPV